MSLNRLEQVSYGKNVELSNTEVDTQNGAGCMLIMQCASTVNNWRVRLQSL